MRKILAVLVVGLVTTLAVAQFGTMGSDSGKQKDMKSRTLVGEVMDAGDAPISEAIVYLKDTKTLAIKSYVSQKDGSFRFNALSPNVDYEVYAQKGQKKSALKKLSQFDSRPEPRINLKIEN